MLYVMCLLKNHKGHKAGDLVLVDYPNNFSLSFSGSAKVMREASKKDIKSGQYKKL